MAVNRVCLALLLTVCFQTVVAKPFFGDFWCDFIVCDDDDDDDVTTSTSTTAADYDYGCDCRPQRRRTTTTPAPANTAFPAGMVLPNAQPTQFNVEIPPNTSGVNFSFMNTGNRWNIVMIPRPGGGTATTTSATTTVVTTTASGTTAGTNGGATMAAPASTTAAATTAAA